MENFILPGFNYNVQFMHNAKDVIESNISNPSLRNEILNNLHPIYEHNNQVFSEIKIISNIVFDIFNDHFDSLQKDWEKTIGHSYVKNLKEFVLNANSNTVSTILDKNRLLDKFGIVYNPLLNKYSIPNKSKYNLSLEDRISFYVLENYLKITKYNVRKIYSTLYKENNTSTTDAINVLSRADAISTMTNSLLSCNRIKQICKNLMAQESSVFLAMRQSVSNISDACGYVVRGRKVKIGTKFKLFKQSGGFGKHHSRKSPDELAFKIYDENNKLIDNWEYSSFTNVVICKF